MELISANLKKRLIHERNILKELVKRDLKLKYKDSVLGFAWTILNPLLMMIVLNVVFSEMFNRNIANFPVYVLIGRIFYSFFSDSTKAALTGITKSAGILKKIAVPTYLFPASRVCSMFVTFLLSFVALFGVMLVTGAPFGPHIILIIIPLIYIFLLSYGVGLFMATLTVFFRDMEHLYAVVLTLLTYVSAIFYPISLLPDVFEKWIFLNPLYVCILTARTILLEGTMAGWKWQVLGITYGLLSCLVGWLFYRRNKHRFIFMI